MRGGGKSLTGRRRCGSSDRILNPPSTPADARQLEPDLLAAISLALFWPDLDGEEGQLSGACNLADAQDLVVLRLTNGGRRNRTTAIVWPVAQKI